MRPKYLRNYGFFEVIFKGLGSLGLSGLPLASAGLLLASPRPPLAPPWRLKGGQADATRAQREPQGGHRVPKAISKGGHGSQREAARGQREAKEEARGGQGTLSGPPRVHQKSPHEFGALSGVLGGPLACFRKHRRTPTGIVSTFFQGAHSEFHGGSLGTPTDS